jgi:ribonuclease Z
MGVPRGPRWSELQSGRTVRLPDGREVHPSDVMGEPRSGRKFSFVTDSLYFPEISQEVSDSDLLICEGMFEQALIESAVDKRHMTARQAAQIRPRCGQCQQLGLIH